MKSNKGFSLVELVVVIAIMAILATVATISIRAIFGTQAKECARNIESQLNNVRVKTMGKNSVTLEIYKGADGAYYSNVITNKGQSDEFSNEKKIGKSRVEVSYSLSEDYSGKKTLEVGDKIVVEFDRSSGAVKESGGKCCSRIWVSQGNTEKIITIYKETGKVEYE